MYTPELLAQIIANGIIAANGNNDNDDDNE